MVPESHKLPYGNYSSGIHNAAIAIELGEFTSYWSHLEAKMIDILRILLGGDDTIPCRQIWYSVINYRARVSMLRSLLETSDINQNRPIDFDTAIDEFQSLSKKRNELLHGLLWTHQDGRVFLQEASADNFSFMQMRELEAKTIATLIERVASLNQTVERLATEARRGALQEKPLAPHA